MAPKKDASLKRFQKSDDKPRMKTKTEIPCLEETRVRVTLGLEHRSP